MSRPGHRPIARLRVVARTAAVAWVVFGAGAAALFAAEPEGPLYERDVLPILTAHCLKCHGREARKAGLDLRTFTLLSQGGESGSVLTAGSLKESPLYERIADRSMPPEGELPLRDEQIEAVRRWIDAGAHAADTGEPPQETASETSAEDRDFWAFRPLARNEPPAVRQTVRARTPVDAFVLAKLEERGLSLAPDAEPRTLVRRAYFDLVGLPPSPEEVDEFLRDASADAYERLLDRLLASPHFGERWGRHWLDASGYVDTAGGDNDAGIIKMADGKWRYRDYVIESFNDDKPFDRFLTEQLAGDELDDWRSAEHFTPEMIERLTATTFLRSSSDDTDENELNTADIRHGVLARTVETVASNLLGLTVNCARCHSHKYDPIPHRDYYRLTAIFTPAMNPQSWLQPRDRALADIAPQEKAAAEKHNAEIRKRIDEAKRRLSEIRRPYQDRLLDQKLTGVPEPIRGDTKTALQTPADKRNEVQKYLAGKFEATLRVAAEDVAAALSAEDRLQIAALEAQLAALPVQLKSWGTIQAVYDVGQPPVTYLLKRGNHDAPGAPVAPGFLSVLSSGDPAAVFAAVHPTGATSGRRLALARWLTERDTPAAALVARVMVNRVWQQLFGVGIVETADNFGHSGAQPTHPELLDWLARQWIEAGYRWKPLVKRLMLSSVYRQASTVEPARAADVALGGRDAAATAGAGAAATGATTDAPAGPDPYSIDPANHLLWRQRLRRLQSEAVRDAILATSGKLDRSMFGPPIPIEAKADGSVVVRDKDLPSATSPWRRSMYILARRNYHLSMLDVFDQPVVSTNCTRRDASAVVLQSLAMLNDGFVIEQAGHFAERVAAAAPVDRQVLAAFRLALAREPTAKEAAWCEELLRSQFDRYRQQAANDEEARRQALGHLCQMLLNASEFLYVQ
ncbi:MAG: PSD1 domain-containing protein [Planctomycetia bacterium]|nr:PSD1 domain-containing protein [Planctomycetia bacterium]